MQTGDLFNELMRETDPVSGREVWRLTAKGINAGISFHHRSQFTDDSRYLVFHRRTPDQSAILRADLETGALTVVATAAADLYPSFAVVPRRNAVAIIWERQLQLVDLETLRCRVLVDQFPEDYGKSCVFGTIDGAAVGYALHRRLPYPVAMSHTYDTAVFDAYVREFGGRPGVVRVVDIDSGEDRLAWEEPKTAGNHIQPSPVDPDLWLVERDQPPLFSWMGDRGKTPRVWLVNRRTGASRPVATRNDNQFQMHSSWSHDGQYVVYHGRDRATGAPLGQNGGGHYIGASRIDGTVVWEEVYPHFYYGHVGGHTQRNAVIFDSLTTPDLLQEVAFLEPGAPFRVLGRHGSDVRYGQQETHPHPQMSPDGRCIAYNRFDGTRYDVCLLRLE